MFVVKFVRSDRKPPELELYYYNDLASAQYHLDLFVDDDSGLYDRIELINDETEEIIDVLDP